MSNNGMRKIARFPENVFTAGPYSPAVVVGDLVFISGQGPVDPEKKLIAGESFEEQAQMTFQNVARALAAAECTLDDCVKVNVYLLDLANFDRMNSIYRALFREPYPAHTTVGSDLWHGIQIEVDVIAVKHCGTTAAS
jgi:2-iminobutanoate/2-iminopropanoate deaminase